MNLGAPRWARSKAAAADMPAARPSPVLLRTAAQIARDTGCTVEIERETGNVRVVPPKVDTPPHDAPKVAPKEW